MVVTHRAPRTQQPEIVDLPPRLMAEVQTVGDPNVVGKTAISALYGAVYTLKFARKHAGTGEGFKVGALRARWPDIQDASKGAWRGIWGIPVPEDTTELPQKSPDVPVALTRWAYGKVAQIVHLGPYSTEQPTIERLHAFISEQGYDIVGPHEEEYLTRPDAKTLKTIIRYQVAPSSRQTT